MFLGGHDDFLCALDSFLLTDFLKDYASLVVLIFVKAILFYFVYGLRDEKRIFFYYFPSIKI